MPIQTNQNLKIEKFDLSEIVQFGKWIRESLPLLKHKFTDDYLANRVKYTFQGEILKAVLENKTVGFLAWFEDSGDAYLWLMTVLPAYQKQGIGSFLLDITLERLRKIGYTRVWAKVKDDNSKMLVPLLHRGFYIKGFSNEGGIGTVLVEKLFNKKKVRPNSNNL